MVKTHYYVNVKCTLHLRMGTNTRIVPYHFFGGTCTPVPLVPTPLLLNTELNVRKRQPNNFNVCSLLAATERHVINVRSPIRRRQSCCRKHSHLQSTTNTVDYNLRRDCTAIESYSRESPSLITEFPLHS